MTTMNLSFLCAALVAASPGLCQGMDMQGMDMQGMDMTAHADAPVAAPKAAVAAPTMGGMAEPATKGAGAGAGAGADPDARTADAYAGGYTLTTGPFIPPGVAPPRMADQMSFGSVLVDRLETGHSDNAGNWTAYDVQAWWGRDFNRVWVKAEGRFAQARLEDARTELLWDHAVASFWDAQAGLRHDRGGGPDRNWLAFGVQGLAPYWFDVEATGYIGDRGRSALRLNGSYDLFVTQRWVLQPQGEINVYAKDDPARDIGSGLADASAGLRLRYEFTRQFAPYVGVEWRGRFGRTADLARASGSPTRTTDIVAGVRFWF